MTQKEYEEKIAELEGRIKELTKIAENEALKTYNYEQLLKDYHRVSEELSSANRAIDMHIQTEQSLNETIRRYGNILDRVSISIGDRDRF
jgi:hypothetical protein